MKHRIIPAIMSGGAGTRLWPASTEAKPKQFHALNGAGTMIQETLARVRGETDQLSFTAPIVLANVTHADLVETQLAAINAPPAALVLEPMGRNTAALGALAAAVGKEIDPDALVLLLAADHVISDVPAFHDAIARAAKPARERIVTFGIAPNRPETGYGYIKRGALLNDGVYAIEAFKEKPALELAKEYVTDPSYSWNAGIFFFKPDVVLREFGAAKDIRDFSLAALASATRTGTRIALDAGQFSRAPSQPFDIAVMEHTTLGAVAPCDIGWADVGAWDEIWRLAQRDERGNAIEGSVIALDARDSLIRADGVTIATAGVSDLIIVASGNTVVIVPRSQAQDVKKLLEAAKAKP